MNDEIEKQRREENDIIKIKVIDNGLNLKTGPGWLYFQDMAAALPTINARIAKIKESRKGVA